MLSQYFAFFFNHNYIGSFFLNENFSVVFFFMVFSRHFTS